jgi:predicted DNA-binding protein (MmcQ/YjbR family)
MKRDRLLAYCASKPGAVQDQPFGDGVIVYKVGGKMFALCSLEGQPSVNLKCDPALATELRAEHPAVSAGYHMNKRHWNTVLLDGTLRAAAVREMVDHSYDLVVAALPKRVRERLHPHADAAKHLTSVVRKVRRIPGVVERESRFAPKPAWWIDGREFMHADGAVLDIRLTKPEIRAHRELLRTDDRIELRASDWLTFEVRAASDVGDAVDLIQMAVDANRRRP